MEQQQDRTGPVEQARARLDHLINHPDKTVSVAEYKAQLAAAQKEYNAAWNEAHRG